MRTVKPLLAHWKAKDIPDVKKGLDTIPCDKITSEYLPYPFNYRITRDYFLQHPEYTHFIADPNDIIATKEHYNALVKRLEKIDYPVLSGVCNVDLGKYKNRWNICENLPDLDYKKRRYYWIPDSQRLGLVEVKFAGFPFMFIRRDIVEKIPFYSLPYELDTGQPGMMELNQGWAGDLAFCTCCDFYSIPIMVDTDVRMKHLRFCGEMKIGKADANVWFDNGKRENITYKFKSKYYGLVS